MYVQLWVPKSKMGRKVGISKDIPASSIFENAPSKQTGTWDFYPCPGLVRYVRAAPKVSLIFSLNSLKSAGFRRHGMVNAKSRNLLQIKRFGIIWDLLALHFPQFESFTRCQKPWILMDPRLLFFWKPGAPQRALLFLRFAYIPARIPFLHRTVKAHIIDPSHPRAV